jgi:hypothetical protein
VLHRANKAFLEGRSRHIAAHTGRMTYLMALLVVVITLPCVQYWVEAPSFASTVLLGFPAAVGLIILGIAWREKQHRRLLREGRLIQGSIQECLSRLEDDDG